MAVLGRWSGGAVSILPSTSWAGPNGMFPTQQRNDGSAYSFDSAASILTLPGEVATGYLLVASYELEDDSNGRANPQGRFVLNSGTGTFVSAASSGYNRDASEDRSYIRCWSFLHNPSAGATIQFQWRRDSDVPTGGTERAVIEVIPLYYADIGIYSSASTACPGNTTPSQVTGFSGTDGSNITLSGNTITMAGDNKRYLCLGGYYWQGIGNARTQRWGGFRVDGTKDDSSKGYSYARNTANADIGEMFTTLLETSTANRTIDMFVYRGDGVASGQGGADVTGNTTGANPNHVMVVLELNDSAEVFSSKSDTNTGDLTGSAGTNLGVVQQVDVVDAASFTKATDLDMAVEKDGDYLFGADISMAAVTVSTGARHTMFAEFTINQTPNNLTFAGDYLRNNQGSQDTFGISANMLSFQDMISGDEIGVEVFTLTGSESGGNPIAPAGWMGLWGLNLDTLQGGAPTGPQALLKTWDGSAWVIKPVNYFDGTQNRLVKYWDGNAWIDSGTT